MIRIVTLLLPLEKYSICCSCFIQAKQYPRIRVLDGWLARPMAALPAAACMPAAGRGPTHGTPTSPCTTSATCVELRQRPRDEGQAWGEDPRRPRRPSLTAGTGALATPPCAPPAADMAELERTALFPNLRVSHPSTYSVRPPGLPPRRTSCLIDRPKLTTSPPGRCSHPAWLTCCAQPVSR
jgi:hypothetical protein